MPNLVLAIAVVLLVGGFAGVAWVTGYTLLGLEVADEIRGRTFALVQSLVRIDLLLVLALAPFVSGIIGQNSARVGIVTVRLDGVTVTLFVAGLLAAGVGVLAYRQMDDRPHVSLRADLLAAVRGDTAYAAARRTPASSSRSRAARAPARPPRRRRWRSGCADGGPRGRGDPGARRHRHRPGGAGAAARPDHRRALAPGRGAALRRRPGRARRDAWSARRSSAAPSSSPTATSTPRWPTRGRVARWPPRRSPGYRRWATEGLRPGPDRRARPGPASGLARAAGRDDGAGPDRGRDARLPRAGPGRVPGPRRGRQARATSSSTPPVRRRP